MNFKPRKLIKSFVLIVLLSFVLQPHTGTVSYAKSNDTIEFDQKLQPFIQAIRDDAQGFGYDEADLETLYIGNPIFSYIYSEMDEFQKCEYNLYPIFSESNLLFFVLEYADGNIEITQALVAELANYIHDEIAIISDSTNCYVYSSSNNQLDFIHSLSQSLDNRGILKNVPNSQSEITTALLSSNRKLQDCLNSVIQPYADAINPTITLAVPTVSQLPYSNLCWAASTASIGNYLTGNSYSAVTIAKLVYGSSDFNKAASLETSTAALQSKYGVIYSIVSYTTAPSDSLIYNNLSANYPMYGRWQHSNGTHQTVIRGINMNTKSIYIMDPEHGYVIVGKSNNKYVYTSPYSGTTLTLIGYASKY